MEPLPFQLRAPTPAVRLILPLLGWLGILTGASAAVPGTGARDFEVKAAALYNIISFTEWPAAAFPTHDAPLVIGVLGQDAVAEVIEPLVRGETWQRRGIVVRQFHGPMNLDDCHVLWVAQPALDRWPHLHSQLASQPVLTISDAARFARNGGVIQLAIERNRLQIIVNLGASRERGISISAKVLRLARVLEESAP